MRRKDREVTEFQEIVKIIDACQIMRLGLSDGDFPYIVPVNFAYEIKERKIFLYIHGAMAGRKYELLQNNPFCSFEMDIALKLDYIPEKKDVTMRYQSVMGKARAVFLTGFDRQRAIDEIIMNRYAETRGLAYNRAVVERTAVIRLEVLEITGKANPLSSGADL